MTSEGDKRRMELIRKQASNGDPYRLCFTRYAAQVLLSEIDRLTRIVEDQRIEAQSAADHCQAHHDR